MYSSSQRKRFLRLGFFLCVMGAVIGYMLGQEIGMIAGSFVGLIVARTLSVIVTE